MLPAGQADAIRLDRGVCRRRSVADADRWKPPWDELGWYRAGGVDGADDAAAGAGEAAGGSASELGGDGERGGEEPDLHVWAITSGFPALSAHVLVRPAADCHAIRRQLEQLLEERFAIDHTTLQVDHQTAGGIVTLGAHRADEDVHGDRYHGE